jgi:hypothetical protein
MEFRLLYRLYVRQSVSLPIVSQIPVFLFLSVPLGHLRTLLSLRFDTIGEGLPFGNIIAFPKEFDPFSVGTQRPVFLFLRVPLLHLRSFGSIGILYKIYNIIIQNMLNEHYTLYMFQSFLHIYIAIISTTINLYQTHDRT